MADTLPPAPIVTVRCKPLSLACEPIVTIEAKGRVLVGALPFDYDFGFDGGSGQEEVYRAVAEPLVDKAFGGLNSTLLAYGQTGSGKSHSMTGTVADPGITPRLVDAVFARAAALDGGASASLSCSMLEIYNESLVDLLEPNASSKLDIREDAVIGIHVHGLSTHAVSSADEVHALMRRGTAARVVAATKMNATSSRSHMIFTLRLVQTLPIDETTNREVSASMNLVDLAGSERATKSGATGEALKEGANINRSLSALGMVVNALAETSRAAKRQRGAKPPAGGSAVHVPYRDSKLTRVLQDSLGGNSVTVMLCAVSPAPSERDETLATLHFAERAKAITLKAKRNEITLATAAAAAAAAAAEAAEAAAARRRRQEARASLASAVAVRRVPRPSRPRAHTPVHLQAPAMRRRVDGGGRGPPAAAARADGRPALRGGTRRQGSSVDADFMRTVRRDFWTGGLDWDESGLGSDSDHGEEEEEEEAGGEAAASMVDDQIGEDLASAGVACAGVAFPTTFPASHPMLLMEAVSEEDDGADAEGNDGGDDEAELRAFLNGCNEAAAEGCRRASSPANQQLGTIAEQRTLEALEQADLDAFVAAAA